MLIKKLTWLIICYMLFSIPTYSFAAKANATDIEIEIVHPGTKDKIGIMLLQSVSLIGIPYKWGGNTPTTGLDCSGLIHYIFKQSLGITLPRTAEEMSKLGRAVTLDELEPGDLIFFSLNENQRISHIGMYLGHNKFIQSPRAGKDVQVTEINEYYRNRFIVAKRMVQEHIDHKGETTLHDLREEREPRIIEQPKHSKTTTAQ